MYIHIYIFFIRFKVKGEGVAWSLMDFTRRVLIEGEADNGSGVCVNLVITELSTALTAYHLS